MKLSTQAILRLCEALQHFDAPAPYRDGKVTRDPYQFAGVVRMAMAKNLSRMDEVMRAYQAARNHLVYEHSLPGESTVEPQRMAAFEVAHAALLQSEHDVNLTRVTEAQLDLDRNIIPVVMLAALVPIMKDEEPAASFST
jgi:hypothetical protein